jgi:hypothetical protein
MYLEETVVNLKKRLAKQEEVRRESVVRLMMDNTMLLRELNFVSKNKSIKGLKQFRQENDANRGALQSKNTDFK